MSRSSACALLFLSLAAFAPARAQTAVAIAPDKPLTLDEAIALAVQKNFDLQAQSFSVETQKEALTIAEAAFDPTLTASLTRSVSQAASNTSRLDGSQTEGPRNDNTTIRVGASERLPTNGTVSVTTNVNRSGTNSTNALFNPQYGNSISANVSQPLLQNAGPTVARAGIERAKLGLGIAFITYKSQVLTLISQTENFYYNLVNARETLRIRQLSLAMAQRGLDENSVRRNTGVMTEIDVLTADYAVATARSGVVQAEQSVREAEDALLNFINVPQFDTRPGPVKFEDYTEGAPNFTASYKLARDYYPQTLSAAETLKQLQIDLEIARRNQLPSLNLDAQLGYTARATNVSYWETISNLPNEHGNNWQVGLNYSMPWGRRADKARYRQAQISVNRQKLTIEQLEQQLMISVRTAVRSIETNLATVEIAAKRTQLAERQYEQQQARFAAGLTTSRQVLQAQDDLENARFGELGAKLTLRRASAELRRLEGTSIQRYRIQLPQ